MRRRALRTLLIVAALAVALTGVPKGARAAHPAGKQGGDSSDARLTLVPPGYERAAAGLSHLFHVSGDVFGTIDPIDGDVMFLSERGKQLGVARLPDGFRSATSTSAPRSSFAATRPRS